MRAPARRLAVSFPIVAKLRFFIMGSASHPAAADANPITATDCGRDRNALRLTVAVLAMRAGTKVRACEYWLSRKTAMSADALAALLRSDAGLEVLEAVIG